MKLAMISTHNATNLRDRGEWLDWQPQMNREIRFIECTEGGDVYTTTKLRSYCGEDYNSLHEPREVFDISLTGWWVNTRAALPLMERRVV